LILVSRVELQPAARQGLAPFDFLCSPLPLLSSILASASVFAVFFFTRKSVGDVEMRWKARSRSRTDNLWRRDRWLPMFFLQHSVRFWRNAREGSIVRLCIPYLARTSG